MTKLTFIPPQSVAAKLASAKSGSQPALAALLNKEPRLVELPWYLQWHSMQPGGTEKHALDLLKEFPNRVGPAALMETAGAKLTPQQCLTIWRQFPSACWQDILPASAWQNHALRSDGSVMARQYASKRVLPEEESRLADALVKLNRQAFVEAATEAAEEDLARYLAAICNRVDKFLPCCNPEMLAGICTEDSDPVNETVEPLQNPPWYFADILPTLFAAMDSHAQRVRQTIAMTEVALKVFDALEFSWSEKCLEQITGSARHGKSESVRAWCAAHPGRARLVITPFSSGATDLYRAVADALGIEHNYKTAPLKLREMVEFTVKHSGLMFVFDEAHFLFPAASYKDSPPTRLNWLRTQIVDRSLPVALVSTPQDYSHALAKFVKASGYNIEQWSGRTVHQTVLPEAPQFADLLAILKLKCPEMDPDLQELIARRAGRSEKYIMAVEAIGKRARWIAKRAGRASITLEDVNLATDEFIPPAATPATAPPAKDIIDDTPQIKIVDLKPSKHNVRPAAPAPGLAIPNRNTGANLIPA